MAVFCMKEAPQLTAAELSTTNLSCISLSCTGAVHRYSKIPPVPAAE